MFSRPSIYSAPSLLIKSFRMGVSESDIAILDWCDLILISSIFICCQFSCHFIFIANCQLIYIGTNKFPPSHTNSFVYHISLPHIFLPNENLKASSITLIYWQFQVHFGSHQRGHQHHKYLMLKMRRKWRTKYLHIIAKSMLFNIINFSSELIPLTPPGYIAGFAFTLISPS